MKSSTILSDETPKSRNYDHIKTGKFAHLNPQPSFEKSNSNKTDMDMITTLKKTNIEKSTSNKTNEMKTTNKKTNNIMEPTSNDSDRYDHIKYKGGRYGHITK